MSCNDRILVIYHEPSTVRCVCIPGHLRKWSLFVGTDDIVLELTRQALTDVYERNACLKYAWQCMHRGASYIAIPRVVSHDPGKLYASMVNAYMFLAFEGTVPYDALSEYIWRETVAL